jgi:hypothetical protein
MLTWTPVPNSRCVSAIGMADVFLGGGSGDVQIHVKFRSGRTYVYHVNNANYYWQFVAAASKGRYYVYTLKKRFDYSAKY